MMVTISLLKPGSESEILRANLASSLATRQ
jgi:hypothetical protein